MTVASDKVAWEIEQLRFPADACQVVVTDSDDLELLTEQDVEKHTMMYFQRVVYQLLVEENWTRPICRLFNISETIHIKTSRFSNRTRFTRDEIAHNFYAGRPGWDVEDHICTLDHCIGNVASQFFGDLEERFENLPPAYREIIRTRVQLAEVDTVEELLFMTVCVATYIGPIEGTTNIAERFEETADYLEDVYEKVAATYRMSEFR